MRNLFWMPTVRKAGLVALLAVFLLAIAPSWLGAGDTAGLSAEKDAKTANSHSSYVRFADVGGGKYAMQLAVRTFAPKKGNGPRVTLVSAIHIGSQPYYSRLQQILDGSRLVLFEGVSDDPEMFKKRSATHEATDRETAAEAETEKDFYDELATAAGLISQVKGISYNRPHFHACDLSMRQMRERLEAETKQGGEVANAANEALLLLQEMDSLLKNTGGFPHLVMRGVNSFLTGSPQLRTLFLCKLATIDDTQESLAGAWAPPGLHRLERLILDDRNDNVIRALAPILKKRRPPPTLAIFYGAAHMRGIEAGLIRKHGYRLRETEWVTAFTIQPAAAGLPPAICDAIARRAYNAKPQARP